MKKVHIILLIIAGVLLILVLGIYNLNKNQKCWDSGGQWNDISNECVM